MDTSTPASDLINKLSFEDFCNLCENLHKQRQNRKRQSEIITKYISDFRSKSSNVPNATFFPLMRLLLPQLDRERGAYGIKENKFAKLFIKLIGLPKSSVDAAKLLNFKAPTASTDGSSDFANVVFYVIKARLPQVEGCLAISDLNMHLDALVLMNATNKPRDLEDELNKLVGRLTPTQIKWLIRIILKDMKLGMSQDRIFKCFHDDAADLFDSCNSLSKVCEMLHNPNTRLNEIEIEIFSSCSAMLSKKLEIDAIDNLFKQSKQFQIEKKFDGERFQMHMRDGKFKYFSRNGFDFTNAYGDTYQSSGHLTKHLKSHINQAARSFILDGEMMGWHKYKREFGSKGMAFDIKKVTENSVHRPCFCVFDILYYNNCVITNLPLQERLAILDKVFTDQEGIIIHSLRTPINTAKEVMDALNKVIEKEDEGLILKDVSSFYRPKSRNAGWYKLKPEYGEGVMSELDLIIIGAYYAGNKKHGLVNSFLVGLAVPPEAGENPSEFHSVGKVSTGISHSELEKLCEDLAPHWQQVKNDRNWNPPNIKWAKERPDLWINPSDSVILQVKATELVRSSDAFATNYTLRFPRVEKIREDKPWHDCMTTAEFEELTKDGQYVKKLTKRQVNADDLFASKVIKPPQKQPLNITEIETKSNLLNGKEVCILSGDDASEKEDLERMAVELGGMITQNPGLATWAAVVGRPTVKATNVAKLGRLDVLHAWWLRDLHRTMPRKLPSLSPRALFAVGPGTGDRMALHFDRFGDSFTEDATEDSLQQCLNKIHEMDEPIYLLPDEMTDMDLEIFGCISEYSFMRHIFAYFEEPQDSTLNIVKMRFLLYGGNVCKSWTDEPVTHIICHKLTNISELKRNLSTADLYIPVIKDEWIAECVKSKTIKPLDSFKL